MIERVPEVEQHRILRLSHASLFLLLGLVITMSGFPILAAADSLTVTNVSSPVKIAPDSSFSVSATVQYSFAAYTRIEVDIYDYGMSQYIASASSIDHVQGNGEKSYSFTLLSPNQESVWSLSAVSLYGPNNAHSTNGWFKDFAVAVVNPFWVTIMITTSITSATVSIRPVTDNSSVAVSTILSFLIGLLVMFAIMRRRMRTFHDGTQVY
jgi:hypothetical protein